VPFSKKLEFLKNGVPFSKKLEFLENGVPFSKKLEFLERKSLHCLLSTLLRNEIESLCGRLV